MDIIQAVNTRQSIRAFKPDAVPKKTLQQIMEMALRAPSWANTQPWEFALVTGAQLAEIRKQYVERAEKDFTPDIARPPDYPEPYGTRRRQMTAKWLEIKGIRREDQEGRGWWRLQGLNSFGAPALIFVLIDRSFYYQKGGVNAWALFDCGLIAENIMLLAVAHGLGTIPQAQVVTYPDIVRKVLGLPDSKLVALGIAIGYPDLEDPINKLRSVREPSDSVVHWYGFR